MDAAGADGGVYECRARGIFRKEEAQTPGGGRFTVEIEVISQEEKDRQSHRYPAPGEANVVSRPAVANVDQALVIFASIRPAPNFNLLDQVSAS